MPKPVWCNYGLCHCHRVTHRLSTEESNKRAFSAPHPSVYLSRACPKTLMLGTNWSMEDAKLQHMEVLRGGSKVPNMSCNGIDALSMNAELMSKYGEHHLLQPKECKKKTEILAMMQGRHISHTDLTTCVDDCGGHGKRRTFNLGANICMPAS